MKKVKQKEIDLTDASFFEMTGECLILYDKTNNGSLFFTDGFNTLEALEELNYIKTIYINKVFIERGIGSTYQELNSEILKEYESMFDFTNQLRNLPNDIFIHKLELQSKFFLISIYDNREFTIKINSDEELFRETILKLFSTCFKFSLSKSESIFKEIKRAPNFYFSINDSGSITGKHEDFEELVK